jgi:hypothetical protein
MFFTQFLIQGDKWTSILKLKYVLYSVPHTGGRWTSIPKLKYVLYSVPHTGGQVDLYTEAQVCSLLSPSYRGTGGPPYSSSSMFFTQSLIQGERWTSILKLKYVCSLLSPSYRGTGGPPYSSSSMFFTQSLIQGDRWTSIVKLKFVLYSVPHTGGQVDLHAKAQVCS